jgi:flagellar basal body-associated protein FliL
MLASQGNFAHQMFGIMMYLVVLMMAAYFGVFFYHAYKLNTKEESTDFNEPQQNFLRVSK